MVVRPDPQENRWAISFSPDEMVFVAENIYGFSHDVAQRLAFQRWYRRFRTRERGTRDPNTLFYPKRENDANL